MTSNRLLYIDNLRIFLICLVVLHHLAITYGAPGGWYYNEGQAGPIASIFMTLFVASNQSFFMRLLFLFSAYFTAGSFIKKGVKSTLTGRVVRLGLPLVLFYFLISPLTIYFCNPNRNISLLSFIIEHHGFGFGPLWFVEVLLIFVFIYAAWQLICPKKINRMVRFPNTLKILLFTFLLGVVTFLFRIWFPVGWSIPHLNFQIAFFPQYIACLIFGVWAYKNNWFDSIDFKISLRWYWYAFVMVFVVFPLVFYFGGASSGNIDPFMGGWYWQSFVYSIWEQLTGFAFMFAFIGIFKKWFNNQGRIARLVSQNTYGIYIFHSLVLVFIAVNLRFIQLSLHIKFVILALPCLFACFLLSYLFRKLPGINRVL